MQLGHRCCVAATTQTVIALFSKGFMSLGSDALRLHSNITMLGPLMLPQPRCLSSSGSWPSLCSAASPCIYVQRAVLGRHGPTSCHVVSQVVGPLRVIVPMQALCMDFSPRHGPWIGFCVVLWPVKHAMPCQPTVYQADNNSFSSIFSPNAKTFHYFH